MFASGMSYTPPSQGGGNFAKGSAIEKSPAMDLLADRSRFASYEQMIWMRLYYGGPPDAAAYESAMGLAVGFWGAQVTSVRYDPSIYPDIAALEYWYDSGASTFLAWDPAFESVRPLLSTTYHETVVHLRQFRSGVRARGDVEKAVHELEALDAELGMARRLGLSTTEIHDLQWRRRNAYRAIQGTRYQHRVDRGNYQLF
jgi:hypothetical protein